MTKFPRAQRFLYCIAGHYIAQNGKQLTDLYADTSEYSYRARVRQTITYLANSMQVMVKCFCSCTWPYESFFSFSVSHCSRFSLPIPIVFLYFHFYGHILLLLEGFPPPHQTYGRHSQRALFYEIVQVSAMYRSTEGLDSSICKMLSKDN